MSVSFSGHPLDGFTSPEPLLVIGDDASAADLAPAGATFTTMAGTTDIGRWFEYLLMLVGVMARPVSSPSGSPTRPSRWSWSRVRSGRRSPR